MGGHSDRFGCEDEGKNRSASVVSCSVTGGLLYTAAFLTGWNIKTFKTSERSCCSYLRQLSCFKLFRHKLQINNYM